MMRLGQSNDYFNCQHCGDFSDPVDVDGSSWCRKCGYERQNIVIGDEYHRENAYSHETYVSGKEPILHSPHEDKLDHAIVYNTECSKSHIKLRDEFIRITDAADIPRRISERAFDVFISIHRKRETRAIIQRALMANCVYRECQMASLPRTCKYIKKIFQVPSKKFNEAEKIFAANVDTKDFHVPNGKLFDMKRDYGINYSMYQHAIFVSDRCMCMKAVNLLQNIMSKSLELHGKTPDKLTAAALLYVFDTDNKSLCKVCDGKAVTECSACVKYICTNMDIARPTLLSQFRLIDSCVKPLGQSDGVLGGVDTPPSPTPSWGVLAPSSINQY